MDGVKRRVNDSLQVKLSLWLSLAILTIALIAGIFAFFSASDEAHELQDDVLRQIATLFDRHHLPVPQGDSGTKEGNDPESHVFVQLLSAPIQSSVSRVGKPPLALPKNLHDGMQTVSIGGKSYRVFVKLLGSGERLAVAQETAVRDETARDSSLYALLPFFILIPVMLVVVTALVRKIFKPIADLSRDIDQRGEQDLFPVAPEPLPYEIRPFVEAINRLLGRVEQAMDAQRRFVADAAHELRSPLTALSLQAERLADSDMSANAHKRLKTLRQGIERGKALLEQLLALARAQTYSIRPSTMVSIQKVFRHVLEDMMPLAEAKSIDIGVVSDLYACVLVNEVDLVTLVKNLVDNAIRYTPAGGRIDLSILAADGVIGLVVEDSGPGIPEAEHERVFDPFYRVSGSDEIGSGLGLSIVRAIAVSVGAKVSLGFTDNQAQTGLRVMIVFPLAES
jgi:two-component system, OmpR family, sensor kinase